MSVWYWIAAGWGATTILTMLAFFGARRSRLMHRWLFGEKPASEVVRLKVQAAAEPQAVDRLAA